MLATKTMTVEELKALIFQLLGQIAPEADFSKLNPNRPIQGELDIDSFDFLNFLTSLNEAIGVEVPEADYGQVATLNTLVRYMTGADEVSVSSPQSYSRIVRRQSSKTRSRPMLLAGDLGATKTTLALYTDEQALAAPAAEATFSSAHYPSLAAMISEFLHGQPGPIEVASLGVAGPIIGDEAHITNLHWRVNTTTLAGELGIPTVYLLNDLAAIANALAILQPADLYTLNEGKPMAGGSMAVIAPGTGLGEAFLVWDGTRYRAYPSEGGHTDFAPTNEWEMGLWQYMRAGLGFDHISYEAVCSGLGIPHIYAYVKASGFADEPDWLAVALAAAADPTPVIVNAALDDAKPCAICAATLDTFIAILGAEAGNLAIKTLATGGVYLGGGIPLHILPKLNAGAFMQAFCHKGRFAELLKVVPVHVIRNPRAALLGAAAYGFAQMK